MKASELIRDLAAYIAREGDREVLMEGERLREVDVVYNEGKTCINLT